MRHKPLQIIFAFAVAAVAATLATSCSNRDKEVEIKELLQSIEEQSQPLYQQMALTQWNAAVSGKAEDFEASQRAQENLTAFYSRRDLFEQLKAYKEQEEEIFKGVTPDDSAYITKRNLDVTYNSFLANQADTALLNAIIKRSTALEQKYGSYRAQLDGKPINDNTVEEILRTSRNNKVLQQVWESHKEIGKLVEEDLLELVRLRNRLATSLGFENYHTMSLMLSEQDPKEVTAILDQLDSLTGESFKELKGMMDKEFAKRYGIDEKDLMPWHYQGRYFQEAPLLYPIDLDKYYKGADLEQLTKDYYASIGLDITKVLNNSSLYPQEGKNQHAFCTDIDTKGDVRVLCNITDNESWMSTMLHEFGHAVYMLGHDAANLPFALRNSAHIFTTEAIAMMMERCSSNPLWLKEFRGISEKESQEIEENSFKQSRLAKLVFSRWVQVVYRFEKEMYANPEQDLNALWWSLVERYQLLKKPEGRDAPDYATKIHIALYPCYYHNYQLGDIFASQMHHYIVQNITRSGNLRRDHYTGNKEVGKWLAEKIFAPGMRYKWEDFIVRATGEPLTAKYYAEQFELTKRN